MRDSIFQLYPNVPAGNCYQEVTDRTIAIFEHALTKRCHIKTLRTDPVHFEIENPQQKNVGFLALDNCAHKSQDSKKCDCIAHTTDKLCFIELKNANKNKGERRKSARQQLEASILHFRQNMALTGYQLEAYMAVGTLTNTYPRMNANNQAARLHFKSVLNSALFEGNRMTI